MSYETTLTLIGTVAGLLYGFAKGQEVYQRIRASRLAVAWQCLEAGVVDTYNVYVRGIKAGAADGKLTDEERTQALAMAKKTAIAYGAKLGIDLVKVLGDWYLEPAIEKTVAQFKAGSVPKALPAPAVPASQANPSGGDGFEVLSESTTKVG